MQYEASRGGKRGAWSRWRPGRRLGLLCSWHDRDLLQVYTLWQADRERDGFSDIFGFEPFDLGFGA